MSVDTQESTTNNYPSFSDIHLPQSVEIPDAYRPSIQSSMAKVTIHIGEPSFKAKDTKAKKQVQNANNLTSTTTKKDIYLKELLVGFKPLQELRTLSGLARTTHYRMTAPWERNGGAVIPSTDLTEYIETVSGLKQQLLDCLTGPFADGYNDAVIRDQALRGGLFNPDDYPKLYDPKNPTKQIMPTNKKHCKNEHGKFYITFEVDEISDNFITRIADEGVDVAANFIDNQNRERFERFTHSVWAETIKHVQHLAGKLDFSGGYKNNPDRNKFQNSAVEHVERMIEVLERFNFDGNADMQVAHKKLREAITDRGINADMLKHNEGVRTQTKQALNDVLNSLPSLDI